MEYLPYIFFFRRPPSCFISSFDSLLSPPSHPRHAVRRLVSSRKAERSKFFSYMQPRATTAHHPHPFFLLSSSGETTLANPRSNCEHCRPDLECSLLLSFFQVALSFLSLCPPRSAPWKLQCTALHCQSRRRLGMQHANACFKV